MERPPSPAPTEWQHTSPEQGAVPRRFTGHVSYLTGAEGERLRADLALVLRDLLAWAEGARASLKR
ncbi:hypothetical protein [Streptomyces sp. NPDC048172]|uniref:hypothetical protein n=1 Tax=Streptomyces sp. NPDC048172 TaxID=3365505 RepID=UPI00371BB6E0